MNRATSLTTKRVDAVPTFRFSTDNFPARNRLDVWREALGRQVVKLDMAPLAKGQFRIEAIGQALPGLGIVLADILPLRVARTGGLLADGNDNLRFVILERSRGVAFASQAGREAVIEATGAVVVTNAEPSTIDFHRTSRMLALNIPCNALGPLLRDRDDIFARSVPKNNGALRLLTRYIEALRDESALTTRELQHLAVVHIYDLAAVALGATRDAAEIAKGRGIRAARLRAIKANIADNLGRSDLSVDGIAAWHRVTPRYVQMLFETEGTTFTELVLHQRLARAHRMLTDPRLAECSIASVAFDAGFGDLSYFNRTFRRRYGGTPSEARAELRRRAEI